MFDVCLYIYDLSGGIARTLSTVILGKRIEGIWHTSVVVHGKEFFYGSHGISYCEPCGTVLREPLQKLPMGSTNVTEAELFSYLDQLATSTFKGGDYRLFDHNCNTFSNHLINHLTKRQIPSYILDLPSEVASTPLGAALKPALNTLSAGLNNIPQFGNIINGQASTNNHSVETIRKEFHPILFEEPLSSEIVPQQIHLLWPADTKSTDLCSYARILAESLGAEDVSQVFDPAMFRLLDMSQLQTSDQCRVVLDLFRLAVWRNPNLLTAMLTDPERHLHHLADTPFPHNPPSVLMDLHASRAKLLCNCLGLSYDWTLTEDSELLLDTKPMVNTCFILLGHDDYRLPGSNPEDIVMPDHRQIGLALAHNIALYPHVSCDEALELGTYLMHLAVTHNKTYKQPIEAIYLLRSLYFLIVRYPFLADLAKACDLRGCLTVVLSEITNPDNAALYSSTVERDTSYRTLPSRAELTHDGISADYMMVKLLMDFLDQSSTT